MLFNSVSFLIYFFPLVTILYFVVPKKLRWLILLIASCIFYIVYIPIYILILFFMIIVDYFVGILIEISTGHKKKLFLTISILSNIGLLGIFKYYNFYTGEVNRLFLLLGLPSQLPVLNLLLPIGLSFHTFQSLSYIIEVYKYRTRAEKNFGIFALYILFYPQLVAGPIERPQHLIPQLKADHKFNYTRLISGLRLMLWGLFKKMLIADRLGFFVDHAYLAADKTNGISWYIVMLLFSFQIYCDFSGYTDIARGSARVMGINLRENFHNPFGSKNIIEFWNTWHISLSSWFHDYVFIPLGVNLRWNWMSAILAVFLLSGIWHGAGWTFIVFGLLHGTYMILSILIQKWRRKMNKVFTVKIWPPISKITQIFITFNFVSFTFIFFRATSLKQAILIVKKLIGLGTELQNTTKNHAWISSITQDEPITGFILIVVLLILMEYIEYLTQKGIKFANFPVFVRWTAYYGLILSLMFLAKFFTHSTFIYFQF